jgi:tRNA(Ile)-lysidine synthase
VPLPEGLAGLLESALLPLGSGGHWWIGYSGGLDSTVLLAAVSALAQSSGRSLTAIHVNHGLSPNASAWEHHCQHFCAARGIPLVIERVQVERAGAGLEAAAREARYAAFTRHVGPQDALLLAHHAGDQTETLLLRILRGTGIDGLEAMASRTVLAGMTVLRPWLGASRQALEAEADRLGLSWIEDESNQSPRFDRNHLRLNVLPALRARWPATDEVLARLANHAASASGLLEDLAALDLAGRTQAGGLSLDPPLSAPRLANLLRYWCRESGLPLPGESVMGAILQDMVPASEDAAPLIAWSGAELRKYRRQLFLMPPLAPVEAGEWPLHQTPSTAGVIEPLPLNGGLFGWQEASGPEAIAPGHLANPAGALCLRWQTEGQSFKPAGRPTRPLKKWWQDAGVPPWWRERTPLLYARDQLLAVPGIGVAEGFQAAQGDKGWRPVWSPGFTTPRPLR